MHGLVCLDERGEVLRPAILWNDQRTAAECAEIEERVGLERLIALTGNRALTGFTAPKLLWLRRHEPDVYARIHRVVLPKDYVRLRLTGEWAIDAADASGTLLFDVAGRRWSNEVLDALEIPVEWLPPVSESTEIAGAGDQQAAALGVGVIAPGTVSVVLGTSGVVLAALHEYAHDAAARVHAFCHAAPGLWEAMGVMLNAAGALQWFRDALAPGMSFDDLTAEASHREAGAEGVLFLPYLQGERTPHADADATALVHRPLAPARPRRARTCGARGSRLRATRLARAPARARRRARGQDERPAVARTADSGSRSWRRCSAFHSSAASSTKGRRTVRRCSQAWPDGTFVERERGSRVVRPCPRDHRAEPFVGGALRRRLRSLSGAVSGNSRGRGGHMRLEGKVAFVTGASRGIGAAVARALSAEGVSVGLASRSGDDLGLENALGLGCDVRDLGQVEGAVAQTVERFGRLDVCVANAGVGSYHTLVDTPVEHLEEMIDVNLKGTIYAARASIPHLVASGEGDLVSVASEAGRRGLPGEAVYCASKFGQVGLTRALDHELREHGVRCTNVCPGGVATDFALEEGYGRTPDVLEGMMSAEDVAEVVLFCITRPRGHRILETALRPMTEPSWG